MAPTVGVVMGSISDLGVMETAVKTLRDLGVEVEARVISAHRTPHEAHQYASSAESRGLKAIIAAAGGAAHLAGVIASLTNVPVIGVPMMPDRNSPAGLDSLLSTVQMPPGVPVATVGLNAAENAAILAAQVLAVADPALAQRLRARRAAMADRVREADRQLAERFGA